MGFPWIVPNRPLGDGGLLEFALGEGLSGSESGEEKVGSGLPLTPLRLGDRLMASKINFFASGNI